MSRPTKDKIILSIVIISRNEEKFIGKCIESVLDASKHIENKEIVLVDSASTDGTIEIAKRYPIKIVQMDNLAPLSAAAGRYNGFLHSRGKYIHFQDGDSILDKEWFKNSLPFSEENSDIAGVVGFITQEEYDNPTVKKWINASKKQKAGEIQWYEEDILIRRDVLEKVGPFNPWLRMREEGELSYRILDVGFKLYRVPYKMSHHRGGENENFYTMIHGKIISAIALGQILRYSLKERRVLGWHVRESRFIVSVAVVFLLMLLSVFPILIINELRPFYFSLILLLTIYCFEMFRSGRGINVVFYITSTTFRWPFLLLGFLKYPKKPFQYPDNVSVIKS